MAAHLGAVPTEGQQLLTAPERLRLARQRAGLKPNEFAAIARKHRNNVSRWEHPKSEVTRRTAQLYVDVCGNTTEEWLLFEIGEWPDGPDGPHGRRTRWAPWDSNPDSAEHRSEQVIDLRSARAAA